MVGLDSQDLRKMGDRLLAPPLDCQARPEVHTGLEKVRMKLQDLGLLSNGLIEFSLHRERRSQIQTGLPKIGLEPNRFRKAS